MNGNHIDQIDEKFWAQRRLSDAQSDVQSLRASAVHGSSTGDPFIEEELANKAHIRKLLRHTHW